MYEHFKRAAEYDPKPEKNGAGYWGMAQGLLFFAPMPLFIYLAVKMVEAGGDGPRTVPLLLLMLAAPSMALLYFLGRLKVWQRTPIPAFWAKCLCVLCFIVWIHVFFISWFASMFPNPLDVAIVLFWVMTGLAVAAFVVLAIDGLRRRKAKGPASGEAFASGTESGTTTG